MYVLLLVVGEDGVSPLQALLHFVKVRALHRLKIQNRGLGPSSPLHAFLTSDLKLEKIAQTLNLLVDCQIEKEGWGEGGGDCVTEERRVDTLRNTIISSEKSRALSARMDLIDRRLTAVCDVIIQASTPVSTSTVLLTPTHDTTIPISHSCPPLPLINRINDEYSILFLNKSMNNILDYNEENDDDKSKSNQQGMKLKIKKEKKNITKNVLLNVPIQRPTLLSFLETTNYSDAEKDFLESNKQWSQLQLQLGTPSGMKKFFIRMRYSHY